MHPHLLLHYYSIETIGKKSPELRNLRLLLRLRKAGPLSRPDASSAITIVSSRAKQRRLVLLSPIWFMFKKLAPYYSAICFERARAPGRDSLRRICACALTIDSFMHYSCASERDYSANVLWRSKPRRPKKQLLRLVRRRMA